MLDLGVLKSVSLRERTQAQFRLEAYNALDRASFQNPNTSVASTSPSDSLTNP